MVHSKRKEWLVIKVTLMFLTLITIMSSEPIVINDMFIIDITAYSIYTYVFENYVYFTSS
jgi:hypothetical protein